MGRRRRFGWLINLLRRENWISTIDCMRCAPISFVVWGHSRRPRKVISVPSILSRTTVSAVFSNGASAKCVPELLHHFHADGKVELIRRSQVGADKIQITQLNRTVFILGLKEIQQRRPSTFICE